MTRYELGQGKIALVEDFGEESTVSIVDNSGGVLAVLCLPSRSLPALFDKAQALFDCQPEGYEL